MGGFVRQGFPKPFSKHQLSFIKNQGLLCYTALLKLALGAATPLNVPLLASLQTPWAGLFLYLHGRRRQWASQKQLKSHPIEQIILFRSPICCRSSQSGEQNSHRLRPWYLLPRRAHTTPRPRRLHIYLFAFTQQASSNPPRPHALSWCGREI